MTRWTLGALATLLAVSTAHAMQPLPDTIPDGNVIELPYFHPEAMRNDKKLLELQERARQQAKDEEFKYPAKLPGSVIQMYGKPKRWDYRVPELWPTNHRSY